MTRLIWNTVGERFYEMGLDRGVLFVGDDAGIPWNGLVSVDETPSGGESRSYYLDGVKYLNLSGKEEFEGSIAAFYSPPEFDECDGVKQSRPGLYLSQQPRKSFGLSYRTKIGNDLNGLEHGYKIHVVYNMLATPANRNYASLDDNPEAPLLNWSFTTKPIFAPGVGYVAHMVANTLTATPYSIQTLEDILYGDDDQFSRLPTVEEMLGIFEDAQPMAVTDMGDGIFTIAGSGLAVQLIGEEQYQITSDTVVIIDEDTAEISSE